MQRTLFYIERSYFWIIGKHDDYVTPAKKPRYPFEFENDQRKECIMKGNLGMELGRG
jgi:hypothetical protein